MHSKTFNFKVNGKDALDNFYKFKAMCVFANQTPHEYLDHILKTFLRDYYPTDKELVTESEVVGRVADLGYSIYRPHLNLLRKYKMLQDDADDKNTRWWYNNESGSVIYDWLKVGPFLAERHEQIQKKKKK